MKWQQFKSVIGVASVAGIVALAIGLVDSANPHAEESGQVDCDRRPQGALQRAIDRSDSGDTIFVTGTCHENVRISAGTHEITLDGGGVATINGPDATEPTVRVRGGDITIRGFTITGGDRGISVRQGGSARIDGNTIENVGSQGIDASQSGFAVIVNNTIQNNQAVGIAVSANGAALIGFGRDTDTDASPNLIQGNQNGIIVLRSGFANIVGNTIRNNTLHGVRVFRGAFAEISDNVIDDNGGNGVLVDVNAGVRFGADTGNTIFTRPNSTTVNNGGFGILCQVGGVADGRLGSLNGHSGAESYAEGCIRSLIP